MYAALSYLHLPFYLSKHKYYCFLTLIWKVFTCFVSMLKPYCNIDSLSFTVPVLQSFTFLKWKSVFEPNLLKCETNEFLGHM